MLQGVWGVPKDLALVCAQICQSDVPGSNFAAWELRAARVQEGLATRAKGFGRFLLYVGVVTELTLRTEPATLERLEQQLELLGTELTGDEKTALRALWSESGVSAWERLPEHDRERLHGTVCSEAP